MDNDSILRRAILVAFCCWSLGVVLEAKHGKSQVHSALVTGTVREAGNGHFISGASIVLECGDGISSKHMFSKEARTDQHGDFQVSIPSSVSKHFKSFKACSVKLASSTISTTLVHLNSRKHKISPRIFSVGVLTFSPPLKRSLRDFTDDEEEVTSMETQNFQNVNEEKLVPSTLIFPFFPFPPNPLNPPILPPNPLLPPPSILPPVPGLTPPPSGILPPVPGLTPPPSSGILPPIPGLTPPPPPAGILPPIPGIPTIPGVPTIPGIPAFASPPPPPPPSLLPPFPFPPGFPGIPPAASKLSAKP